MCNEIIYVDRRFIVGISHRLRRNRRLRSISRKTIQYCTYLRGSLGVVLVLGSDFRDDVEVAWVEIFELTVFVVDQEGEVCCNVLVGFLKGGGNV
jgi:hypothetical protein